MVAFLIKSGEAKDKKVEAFETLKAKVHLDHSEGEESDEDRGNAVVVLKSKPGKSSCKGGSIESFYKPSTIEESVKKNSLGKKARTKLSTQEREIRRNRACEYICQFFYEASIPHNAVTLSSFACMLEAVGRFGKDLDGPSAYEMSGPFLQKRKKRVMETFKSHRETWEHTGCTVMTDAWTDRKCMGVMNLVVHSAHGALFLNSVDCSAVKKDGKFIFELVDTCIEDIGAEKVVQVVTDIASVNTARKIVIWNVRGLNDRARRLAIRSLIDTTGVSIVCFQETKMTLICLPVILETLGSEFDEYVYLPADGTRGGILLAWKSRDVSITDPTFTMNTLTAKITRGTSAPWWITVTSQKL